MRSTEALLLTVAVAICSCSSPAPAQEPDRVRMQHILVAFQGSMGDIKTIARSQAEAGALASELLRKAQAGEDFDALVRQHTDERAPGIYVVLNDGAMLVPESLPRRVLVPAVGDLAFKLQVGEVGMAAYDPNDCPMGWEIIKRLE